MKSAIGIVIFLGCLSASPATQPVSGIGTETVIFFRHGEKPPHDLGQLSPKGLNRALMLSKLLPTRYGKPDYLFAPDPALTHSVDGGMEYSYVRALATIEPLAISLQMPVKVEYGYNQVDKLDAELALPKYSRSLIFVCWEHGGAERAARELITKYGGKGDQVPHWKRDDFGSVYIVKISRAPGQIDSATFTHEQEGFTNLSTTMPTPGSMTIPD